MSLIFAIILLFLAIGGVVVRKTYYYVPVRELKRRAEGKDNLAKKIYPAVAHGSSLRALLWLYIGLTTAASLILLARTLPVWASLLIVGPILWAAFSWLPASRVTKIGARLTIFITPPILWILNFLHPILSRSTDAIQKHTTINDHTGIYEREDLLKLIEELEWQKDSRITPEELEIAKNALNFGEYSVGDILTSRKKLKTVLATDTIGPILIDELHKSGQDCVLVRDKKGGKVIGTLEFKRLGLGSEGKVRDMMNAQVYYINENDSLADALHAFFVTNHPLFIVVNSFEEFVGIISIENILKQLLGHLPGEDFDQFADASAVANRHPKSQNAESDDETPVKTDDKVLE
jgi:CBS domain containing-hemolysin-like protein